MLDIDVHHGNGAQRGFYSQRDVLTVSLHMDHGSRGDACLESGTVEECGHGPGVGFNINIPLPMASGDEVYRQAMARIAVPEIAAYQPDVLIVGAGLDGSQVDPNGRMLLTMKGFHDIGAGIATLAAQMESTKLLVVQEGGYAETYTAYCAHALLEGILGTGRLLEDPFGKGLYPSESPEEAEELVMAIKAARRQAMVQQLALAHAA